MKDGSIDRFFIRGYGKGIPGLVNIVLFVDLMAGLGFRVLKWLDFNVTGE